MDDAFEHGHASAESHQKSENAGGMRWLLTYADMLTLLFVLFVVLYSLNQVAQRSGVPVDTVLVEIFHESFHTPATRGLPEQSGNSGVPLAPAAGPPPAAPATAGTPRGQLAQIATQLAGILRADNLNQSATITTTPDQVDIRFGLDGYFDSASATLTPQFQAALRDIAPVLRTVPYEIKVQGYTNNLPLHSTIYPTAWELSAARAVNTARFLTETQGVPPHNVEVDAFGQWHPRVPNDTPEHLAENRSVDIVITDQMPPGYDDGGPDIAPGTS
jgi:chemotaxis protein MotB